MKITEHLLPLSVFFTIIISSCSTLNKTIKVHEIDSDFFENHIIVYAWVKGSPILVLSEKTNLECENKIQFGSKYRLPLILMTHTEEVTYPGFRLYINNWSIDEKLIFPKNRMVYKSQQLSGLCLISDK